ncbi:outer membrane beta-barrel protein [Photobacterium angustum]|uniref:Outer membrane protein OmpA-like transmembrane domain-containing protein n=1 Tax=Photobacterium angustum TaxID=661 RepID=A0A855SEK5_PHOAN|nr:outer membrane beta-barrel protein [Photobacterium angustum]KJF82117.1 hypothetical protein UB36_08895 [Photobacterium damselae subsp. damselae]KJG01690.1 hypothetical protein UB35_10815 [Photobacterium angustum]KJG16621.1 hypothetical protein UA33_13870 [Photobacterium angustum]KJG22735.1 hypothetical protein UA39_13220 [Photobacterium angustum]KJG29731.1 hypothetical protein UA36_14680 [Photobacterium angustum]
MNNLKIHMTMLISSSLILFMPVAFADTSNISNSWYAGLDLGKGSYNNAGDEHALSVEQDHWAFGTHVGYQFNRYLSTEVAYQYFGEGKASYPLGNIKGNFQQLVVKGIIGTYLNDFYPFLNAGVAAWSGKSKGLREGTATGFSPVYGAGIRYYINSRFSTKLEYQRTESMGNDDIGHTDHQLVSMGVSWAF